ncbi:MAG: hypothetical protein LAN83_01190 [Acidobacteriia bacterium]|nr:hypothetical protein [Terriglobia bacterium]
MASKRATSALTRVGASLGLAMMLVTSARGAVAETVLHSFTRFPDGHHPRATLIFDPAGDLYGTTSDGGTNNSGTVFELTPSSSGWTESVFYSFCSADLCSDGSSPLGPMVLDAAGNLYGVTYNGGANGFGAVFELVHSSNGWTESVLYSFEDGNSDGANPIGGLIFDSGGNLYGTTDYGGTNNFGTVFELRHSSGGWTESVLYRFTGGSDGGNPVGGVVLDHEGNLYGTTYGGGASFGGTVFELTPGSAGWTESALYSFTGSIDGSGPSAGLVLDGQGNLYGTTHYGGAHTFGNVFELTPTSGGWTETVLFNFRRHSGVYSDAGVILDKAGNLYGTTTEFGAHNFGTVFELTPSQGGWAERVLYAFGGDAKYGASPDAGLTLDAVGNLYGTTEFGGDTHCHPPNGCGTVFELLRSSF